MNYQFLYPNEPLPHFVRFISLAIAFIAISLGIFMKLSGQEQLLNMSVTNFRSIFLISLILHISSKDRLEDERIAMLRLQILRFGFGMIIGIIFFMELGNQITNKYFIQWIIGILGVQVIYYEMFRNSNLLDYLSNKRLIYAVLYLVITASLVHLNIWLW